ncbi:protein Brevis radix-like 1 isoform X1 [Zingiber officinale]|uniref:protein Brevis radix-like 1 isoform X1 n=1 Tax=Zingiber officinale TaxID=94328 RepID=UPI001C4D8EFC|nr:protein Brevis radix-like 1 isoform X1 [Zingiber officinale]XP_042457215.1 protein Brevis radix-like 1 isoform X1 [Zingiber officinale]
MLTCIACSKQLSVATAASRNVASGPESPIHDPDGEGTGNGAATPSTRQAIKALTSQIRDMALKASGAYRHCKPCAGASGGSQRLPHHHVGYTDSEMGSASDRFHYAYRRAGMGSGSSPPAAPSERELDMRLKAISSAERTPSVSGRTEASSEAASAFLEDGQDEPKEWVAQVEPGVLITFLSLPQGGNDLKRIRFRREMFNKWQAQRWWAENCDKVMELYNVQRVNRQTMPLPNPQRSEDEVKEECPICSKDRLATPPLGKELLPHNLHRPLMGGGGIGYSPSDSLEQHQGSTDHNHGHLHHVRHYYDSGGLTSTPKLSSISGAKTEISSMDASVRTCSSPDEVEQSGEISASISNASDLEREWVEEDEPGVYITIRELPGGIRELRRVRFSRERFGEMHARLWWEENRARIQEQYL